jgi:hypothetical protein
MSLAEKQSKKTKDATMRRSSTKAGSDIASNYKSWITDKNMLAYCSKKLYTTCPWLRRRIKNKGCYNEKRLHSGRLRHC